MSWTTRLRRWHKWIAVIVGLQLLLWTTSGLVFTLDPIEVVRGETLVAETAPPRVPPGSSIVTLDDARVAARLAAIDGATLAHARGRWVWLLSPVGSDPPDGPPPVLIDAISGERVPAMDEAEARARATALYVGDAAVLGLEPLQTAPFELRGRPAPLWRVDLDDAESTRIYLDATTGALAAVRTDTWRRFDWFWMLHIMDYDERTDFHTPLLTTAASFGVATSLTGILLAIAVLRPRRARD